jgi:hypothetical protein
LVSSTSSRHRFQPGKIKANDGKALPPKPRNAILPMVLILLVLLFVFGIVLSANGGRNLIALSKTLNIPLPQLVSVTVPAPTPRDATTIPTSPWPWLKGIANYPGPLHIIHTPDTMCQSLAAEGQEAPAFIKSGADGWECSMLFTVSKDPAASSLFLHVRGGNNGQFNVVRVKFNLSDGRLTGDISRRSLSFLRAAMMLPPSDSLDESLQEKLENQTDFYFIAGYHALKFRREVDDPNRYNLIGFNSRTIGAEPASFWPKTASVVDTLPTRSTKGPRLSAQSSGSP